MRLPGGSLSYATTAVMLVLTLVGRDQLRAQQREDRPARPGLQFLIPLGSLIVPGIGQYVLGEPLLGAGFTLAAVGGLGLAQVADSEDPFDELPREAEDQLGFEGAHVAVTAGMLSAYDAFRRGIPDLQSREGKYLFMGEPDGLSDLVTAPFDLRFLGRWTTWIDLAYTGAVAALVLSTREEGVAYEPFRERDAAFIAALSFNAGVGEEAMFRGWIYPLLYQNLGGSFWGANGIQAAAFGAGHIPAAREFSIAIGVWAFYEGWLTRRNGWSVRESIFHHFWYDILIGAASFLADETEGTVRITFPSLRW